MMAVDSGTYDPETVARHQKIAETLLKQSAAPREIRSRLQGIGQLGEGLIAGLSARGADQESKDARAQAVAQALAAFGGGGTPAAAAPIAAPVSAGGPDPSMPTTTLVGNNPDYGAPPRGGPTMATVAGTGDTIPLPQRNPLGALNPEFRTKFADLRTAAGDQGAYFDAPEQGSIGNVRTPQQQATLYAQGRTAPGPIVTGTPNSNHITGRALDIVPTNGANEKQIGSVVSALMANDPRFAGMRSGATFSNLYDPLHVELNKPQGTQVASLDPSSGVSPAVGNVAAALQPAAGAPPQGAPPPAPVQVAQNAPAPAAGAQGGSRAAQIAAALNPWTPPAMSSAIIGQLVPHPQAMKIQTRDGSDAIVFVDPVNKTVTDATGKPFNSDSNGPPNPTLSGEDYLKTIPTGRRELITGMLEGRIGPAQMGRYGTKQVQALLEDAARVEPNFDMTTWKGREAGIKDFYGGGRSQETVRKANQSALHFAELFTDKADKLPGTQVPAFNAVANAVNTSLLGKDAAPNFEVNAHALADELSGLFKGAGISDTEIRAWESRISPNMSDQQQRGMARTLLGLYRDSVTALEKKRQDALGEKLAAKRGPVLGKEAEDALLRVEKFGGGQNVSGGGTAPVKVSSPDEARKLPKGTPIILPDDSPGVVP